MGLDEATATATTSAEPHAGSVTSVDSAGEYQATWQYYTIATHR